MADYAQEDDMINDAPFTGQLLELKHRSDRIEFIRTVYELKDDGEFPADTRAIIVGTCVLTTLDRGQIEDVCEALDVIKYAVSEPPAAVPGAYDRPRATPIPEETKALIKARFEEGKTPSQVARETGRPYSSVYYLMAKAQRERRTA